MIKKPMDYINIKEHTPPQEHLKIILLHLWWAAQFQNKATLKDGYYVANFYHKYPNKLFIFQNISNMFLLIQQKSDIKILLWVPFFKFHH